MIGLVFVLQRFAEISCEVDCTLLSGSTATDNRGVPRHD